jgi:hypothetical protein
MYHGGVHDAWPLYEEFPKKPWIGQFITTPHKVPIILNSLCKFPIAWGVYSIGCIIPICNIAMLARVLKAFTNQISTKCHKCWDSNTGYRALVKVIVLSVMEHGIPDFPAFSWGEIPILHEPWLSPKLINCFLKKCVCVCMYYVLR